MALGAPTLAGLARGKPNVGSIWRRLYGPAMSTPYRFDPVELPPECEALRRKVREFIADELAAGRWIPNSDFGSHRAADFSRRLGERGWIGMTWPKRYGGGERSFLERYTVTEELLAAGAPVGCHWIADRQSGPLLLRYGSDEQRETFLPGICRGEIFFAIGMSEPDSGSDLASIRTRAIPVCGGYEVTGAKVWTSYAHESHFAITLVRTDPLDPKNRHAGLTQLIVDLTAPGVTIRPIRNLAGEHDFNEIVLDRVFVPSERLVGGEGDGLASGNQRTGFRTQRPGAVFVVNAGSGRVDRARRERARLGNSGGARSHRREFVDVAADVAVGRRHAASGRNPEPRSRACEGPRRRLRARGPGAGACIDPAASRQFRRRPAGGGAGRGCAACAVLDIARRHARNPARDHRPRPRAALRTSAAMRDTILYDSAMRLFGDHVTPRVLEAAEAGEWPAALWRAVDEAGYLDVLADDTGGMVEAVAILRAAGHNAAPIPLPETMLARWLCGAGGVDAPAGPLSIALEAPDDPARFAPVPWGVSAEAVAIVSGSSFTLAARERLPFQSGASLAGEPRDVLTAIEDEPAMPLPNEVSADLVRGVGALLRAAQMAGAMEAALGLATTYANDRVQFGRPIGKFQAIQQHLALLAEEAAAALVAVESAAISVAEGRSSAEFALPAAKIRAGEAAGVVAEIAHQVHGAIGFTEEHSLHHLTRRLWSWRDEFGDESYWATLLGNRIASAGSAGLWPLITTP